MIGNNTEHILNIPFYGSVFNKDYKYVPYLQHTVVDHQVPIADVFGSDYFLTELLVTGPEPNCQSRLQCSKRGLYRTSYNILNRFVSIGYKIALNKTTNNTFIQSWLTTYVASQTLTHKHIVSFLLTSLFDSEAFLKNRFLSKI